MSTKADKTESNSHAPSILKKELTSVVRADDKHLARLNIIKDLLGRLHYPDKDERLTRPDTQIVFAYDVSNLENGQLAK